MYLSGTMLSLFKSIQLLTLGSLLVWLSGYAVLNLHRLCLRGNIYHSSWPIMMMMMMTGSQKTRVAMHAKVPEEIKKEAWVGKMRKEKVWIFPLFMQTQCDVNIVDDEIFLPLNRPLLLIRKVIVKEAFELNHTRQIFLFFVDPTSPSYLLTMPCSYETLYTLPCHYPIMLFFLCSSTVDAIGVPVCITRWLFYSEKSELTATTSLLRITRKYPWELLVNDKNRVFLGQVNFPIVLT